MLMIEIILPASSPAHPAMSDAVSALPGVTIAGVICLIALIGLSRRGVSCGTSLVTLLVLAAVGVAALKFNPGSVAATARSARAVRAARAVSPPCEPRPPGVPDGNRTERRAHVIASENGTSRVTAESSTPDDRQFVVARWAARGLTNAFGDVGSKRARLLLSAGAVGVLMIIGYTVLSAVACDRLSWGLGVLATLAFAAVMAAVTVMS